MTDNELCPNCGKLSGVLRHVRDERDNKFLIRECTVCLHAWEPPSLPKEQLWHDLQESVDLGASIFADLTGAGITSAPVEIAPGLQAATFIDPPVDEAEIDEINLEPEQPDTPEIVLSGQQEEAANGLMSWFQECEEQIVEAHGSWEEFFDTPLSQRVRLARPVFRIFGYAGTGKTTMTKEAVRRLQIALEYIANMTFTGKAALVMTKHGNPASTMHSAMYEVKPTPEHKIKELEQKIKAEHDKMELKLLRQQLKEAKQPQFEFNHESHLRQCKLITLDEVSMVNQELGEDVLRYRVPVLVLGDPGQLPPIEGAGYFTECAPDHLLTEIRRQAEGNPIIDFATRARKGIPLPMGVFQSEQGQAIHLTKNVLTDAVLMQADQIICGKNNTRRSLNDRVRACLGRATHLPQPGDKLICLKNRKAEGLFNGLFAEVIEVGELFEASIMLKLRLETDAPDAEPKEYECLRSHFDVYVDKTAPERVMWYDQQRCQEFDFGYAITVHKAQGSQWDSVLLFDDGMFKWKGKAQERKQWLYTAVTRAAEAFCVVD